MGFLDGLWGNKARLSVVEEQRLAEVLAADEARRAAYSAAWLAYGGEVGRDEAEVETEGTIRLNKCAPIVDTASGLLFAPPPTYNLPAGGRPPAGAGAPAPGSAADPTPPDHSPAPEAETPDEAWLADCLRANNWPEFLGDVRTNGGLAGTAYALTLPPDKLHPYPQVQVLNSAQMTIRWHPRDIRQIVGYVWQDDDSFDADGRPITARQRTLRQPDGTWMIFDEHAALDARPDHTQDWVLDKATAWARQWAPILHCKNLPAANQVYGQPDYGAGIIALNRALNRQYTNDADTLLFEGHPIIWGTGFTGKLSINPKVFNNLPVGAALYALAPVVQHEAAAALRKEILDALDEESRTPAVTRGRGDFSNPSGVAIRLQFWPMDLKLAALQMCYEPFLTEIVRRLLELGGKGSDRIVSWTWPRVLPVDRLQETQALALESEMGTTSKATIAAELGRTWADEQQNLADERAADAPPPLVPGVLPETPLAVPLPKPGEPPQPPRTAPEGN